MNSTAFFLISIANFMQLLLNDFIGRIACETFGVNSILMFFIIVGIYLCNIITIFSIDRTLTDIKEKKE